MRFRKLRIAWSVAGGVAGVLLIALWAQSYWRHDALYLSTQNSQKVSLESQYAVVSISGDANPLSLLLISDVYIWREPADHRLTNWVWFGFGLDRQYHHAVMLSIPHWFAIVSCAVFGAIPWAISSYRFSLRTLLIATTTGVQSPSHPLI